MGGTATSQIIIVIASPVVTRLYNPEDFGLFSIYTSVVGLVSCVACLRYELAIPLPEKNKDALNLIGLCSVLITISTFLTGLAVFCSTSLITGYLGYELSFLQLLLIPAGVFLSSSYLLLNYFAIRFSLFGSISIAKVVQSSITTAMQIVFYSLGAIALIIAQLTAQICSIFWIAIKGRKIISFKEISFKGIIQISKRYKSFPIFSTFEVLVNSFANLIPPLILALYFGPVYAGFYALTYKVLALPTSLLGGAVNDVFLSKGAALDRESNLAKFVYSVHGNLAHLSLPFLLLVFITGPDLFTFIFGADWKESGRLAQIMAPWLYFQFVSSPISTVFAIKEKLKDALIFQFISCLIRTCSILIGCLQENFIISITLYSAASSLSYLVLLLWSVKLAGKFDLKILISDLQALLIAFVCCVPVFLTKLNLLHYDFVFPLLLSISLILISIRTLIYIRKI